jgi:hypothetical protein
MNEIESLLHLLAETPVRIKSAAEGAEHARLHSRPDENAWSMNDILAHLRACADVWGKSIQAMIGQDHPTLRYVSPRTWIRRKDYPDHEFGASLQAFSRQREDLLQALRSLGSEGWSRGATFTGTTRGREQTVMSYAQRLAQHEKEHCEQMEKMMAEPRP